MATAPQDMLSARQLLVLGLLENLTQYFGKPPTFGYWSGQRGVPFGEMDKLIELGLVANVDGYLVRRYEWQPASHLLKPARSGDWALGKARTEKRKPGPKEKTKLIVMEVPE